jgi:glycopeptide antibiotics resistance protein
MLISRRDVAINIALYVPFGICGMVTLRRADGRGVARVTAIALLFSFLVEALQLYTADRVASVTDIGSAGVGTVAGAALVVLWRSRR